jgi:glycine oxidase
MSPDVAIVGGGVIGCAIAYELARARAGRVVVIERARPGAEASGAAAGLLAVAASRAPRGVVFELRRASATLFPDLARALREESGVDVEYSSWGTLDVALGGADAERLERHVARRREQGLAAELLSGDEALAREPTLHRDVRAAALFPGDRAINGGRLVEALRVAAERRGVEFRTGAPLTAVETVPGKVLAIEAGGERFTPGRLVIAAGAWSAEVGALLGVKIPVRPDRGEMMAVRSPTPLGQVVLWDDAYLVPRRGGEVLIGGTSARGEWEKTVSAGSLALLVRRAARMIPQLGQATLLRTWAGLRPLSALRRPIIGPLRGYANVLLATGHHRSGILLAPITGKLVAELIGGGATSIPIHPFCYRAR